MYKPYASFPQALLIVKGRITSSDVVNKYSLCCLSLQGSHSPTAAFAKLRFGAISETGTPHPTPLRSAEEPEFMQCYSPDTIHQNTSATSSPCDGGASKISGLHILNTNCNNGNPTTSVGSRSPSPNSMRPIRPMSLKLSKVEEVSNQPITRRSSSAGSERLEDVRVGERTASNIGEQTISISEAAPAVETQSVTVSSAAVLSPDTFKQPEQVGPSTDVVLREPSPYKHKVRPRSITLSESPRKESPTTPIKDCVASDMNRLLAYSAQSKSRSLEDILHLADSIAAAPSSGSISSTGSHSSLHGSLEFIKVL